MTIEEIKSLLIIVGSFSTGLIVSLFIFYLMFRYYLSSYLAQKGQNLATKEDIEEITRKIEDVKLTFALPLEEFKSRNQLKLVALERRLQVHQEAFTLWREVYGALHTEEIGKVILRCQDWWEKKCLYLEPEVRNSFVAAYGAANTQRMLVQSLQNYETINANMKVVTDFPNILFKAMELPLLNSTDIIPVITEIK